MGEVDSVFRILEAMHKMTLLREPDRIDHTRQSNPEQVAANRAIPERNRASVSPNTTQFHRRCFGGPDQEYSDHVASLWEGDCNGVNRPPGEPRSEKGKNRGFTRAEQPHGRLLVVEEPDSRSLDKRDA